MTDCILRSSILVHSERIKNSYFYMYVFCNFNHFSYKHISLMTLCPPTHKPIPCSLI